MKPLPVPSAQFIAKSALFLALAVPTAVLVRQAYSQLKWEAFHQHQVLAQELALRIDARAQELLRAEEVIPLGEAATVEKLEEFEEATRMFNQAMKYEEATLESNNGPRVAPLAARRLREIGR